MRKIDSGLLLRYVFSIPSERIEENIINGIAPYFNALVNAGKKDIINAKPNRFINSLINILLYIAVSDNEINELDIKFINKLVASLGSHPLSLDEIKDKLKNSNLIENIDYDIDSFKKPRFLTADTYLYYDFLFGLFCFDRLSKNEIQEVEYRFIINFLDPSFDKVADPEGLSNYI